MITGGKLPRSRLSPLPGPATGRLRPGCGRGQRPRAGQRMAGRHPAGRGHRRRHGRSAGPGGHHDDPFPVLGSGAGRAAARRSAPGQLPAAGRRAAGRARLRCCRPAARGFPPIFGRVLRLLHDNGDLAELEDEFRSYGYLRDGVSVDLAALRAFLAPLAEPSRAESFRFSREWLRTETAQASALRSSSVLRRLNLPPSYVLIHRVLASGLGVLCQLECQAPFRAEVLRWMPGYADPAEPAPPPQPACSRSVPPAGSVPPVTANGHGGPAPPVTADGHARSAPPARPEGQARSIQPARAQPRETTAQPGQAARPAARHR